MNKVWFGFVVAGFINMIFAVISLSTAVWIKSDSLEASVGLWQSCTRGTCVSNPQGNLDKVSSKNAEKNSGSVFILPEFKKNN